MLDVFPRTLKYLSKEFGRVYGEQMEKWFLDTYTKQEKPRD